MFKVFGATLSPMLVMFCYMLIGFIANKCKLVPDNTASILSKLENYFFVPALIINTFMKYCTVQSIAKEYRLILYSFGIFVIAICISIPLSQVFSGGNYYKRNIYKYALTFGNFSFMGNAIVPAILGADALYSYMLYILPLNVAVYTWGVMILVPKGEKKQSVLKSLLNPIFISIIVGILLGLSGLANYVPKFAADTIGGCASCMGPIAMILTGMVIGGYDLKKLVKNTTVFIATLLRLIVLPVLFISILLLIKADKTTIYMTFFAFGTPLGLNTVVFPAAYGGDTSTGASMAMISHTLCVITIPIIFAIISII